MTGGWSWPQEQAPVFTEVSGFCNCRGQLWASQHGGTGKKVTLAPPVAREPVLKLMGPSLHLTVITA